MIEFLKKNAVRFITWGLLVLCCLLLAGILITLHKNNKNGRYTLHCDKSDVLAWPFYVIDTKTGQVWLRMVNSDRQRGEVHLRATCVDFGTPEKPTWNVRYNQPLEKSKSFIPEGFELEESVRGK